MTYLTNEISLNTMSANDFTFVRFKRIKPEDIPFDCKSYISHANTARIVSQLLGRDIENTQIDVSFMSGDTLYLALYTGPKLSEGVLDFPEGSQLEFYEVTAKAQGCFGCPATDCNSCSTMTWTHGR